ncbi:MAG TPA: PEGA domain-containing protein [Vitreimonas sp.]|nr:PEGA domain-containing protein [Vitreimonas sp.]
MRKYVSLVLIVVASCFLSACNPLDVKKKAGLYVLTNDIPSSLFLDGQYLDKTPFIDKNIKPGTYTLRIQPEDASLTAHETTVTLEKGLLTVVIWKPGARPELSGGVMYEMKKLKSSKETEVSIVTIPDGGIVRIDQQPTDFAPLLKSDLSEGPHEFEVSLPSYETQKHTINLTAGHRINVTVKLAKNPTPGSETTPGTPPASGSAAPTSRTAPPATPTSLPIVNTPTATRSARAATVTGPRVKILATNFFQNGAEVLRVRSAASSAGAELGFAPVGSEYSYTGVSQAGWHQITFEGQEGWVSQNFSELLN